MLCSSASLQGRLVSFYIVSKSDSLKYKIPRHEKQLPSQTDVSLSEDGHTGYGRLKNKETSLRNRAGGRDPHASSELIPKSS